MPTDEALDRLRGRDLVYQREKSTFDHTREFLFKHALSRDVAYEGMLRRHRRNYHRLAGSWFERMAESSQRADEYAGLIADHYANAGDREAAARWYLVAGEQAASVHGLADANRLLGQGIDLVPDTGDAAALRPAAGSRDRARPDRRSVGAAGDLDRARRDGARRRRHGSTSAASGC